MAALGHTPPALWESWELDPKFFTALSQWTLDNPETSLDRILDRVCVAIEHGREFFELIPDGSFPARGLVKALAHLVRLGNTIANANSDVQAFAKEVVQWVCQIKSTFAAATNNSTGGQFTRITWKNLTRMRDLIDEICKWAASRLLDRRWSLTGIKNKLVVNTEIAEFRARISEARAIFNERSLVSQAGGIDSILQMISKMFERQGQIALTLAKIHATQSAHLEHILERLDADDAEEARRREADERRRYVAQMLSIHAVANTSYVEQGKPPCDKDTRVQVLKEIMGWVEDTTPGSQNFLWLTGDPGCGKSAITASIARECKDKDFLWAQFFINRNNVDTTNPNAYFPSIARQLTARSDLVELEIHDHLKAKPSLMDAMSSEQATRLFIDAIRVASRLNPKMPVLVVIDGLDETVRSHLKSTAAVFSLLFDELSDHPNAKVFISSRTEDDIRNPFALTMNNKCVKHLHLDTAAQSSIQDVSRFLRRKIAQIVLDNDLDWRVWPGDERFDILATKASGLFIWAVTVAKFLQEQIDLWGTECLSDILDKLNSDGMGDINTLYGLILSSAYNERTDEWAFECFRRLVGAIVVLHEPLCINDISRFLNLQRSSSSPPVDVVKFVKRLRTVLVAGTNAVDGRTIPRLHKSFFEFVTSNDRVEAHFRVDPNASHRELGFQCLHQLALVRSATANTRIPVLFRYAFKFWSQHLSLVSGTASGVMIADDTLDLPTFQSIVQQSSNNASAAPTFIRFLQEKAYIRVSMGSRTRTWDTLNGIDPALLAPEGFLADPTLIPDRSYNTAASPVAFLPDGRHVTWVSWDKRICLWDTQSQSIIKHPFQQNTRQRVLSVAFSPIHNHFVTGTAEGSLCVWDVLTGDPVGVPFRSHPRRVTCAAFSPTDDWLVSGYSDGALQFWDVQRGVHAPLGPLLRGHAESMVHAVTFSLDRGHALSGADDGTICLWDTRTGTTLRRLERSLFKGHTGAVKSVAFSPDGKLAASGSHDQTIRFWDVQSGEQVGAPLEEHTDTVRSVEFSPNGKQMVSGSSDHTVCVWDVQTKQLIGAPLVGHTNWVRSVAFSPDGDHICSGSGDQTIRIWTAMNPLRDDFRTKITAFSPTGEQTLSVFDDDTIRLWDARADHHDTLPLEGGDEVHGLRHVSFSRDGSRIAASSLDVIYLWDSRSGRLLDSSHFDSQSTDRFDFAYDNDKVVLKLNNKTSSLWEVNTKLLEVATPGDVSRMKSSPSFFPASDITGQNPDDAQAHSMRWYPSNEPDSGLWAFVDNHIIRARKDGSTTIVPVTISGEKEDSPMPSLATKKL